MSDQGRGRPLPRSRQPAPPPISPDAKAQPRKFKFPTAFTVLAACSCSSGSHRSSSLPAPTRPTETGSPIPGTYHELPSCSAPAATAPALDADSPTESGQAPADAESAPGDDVARGRPAVCRHVLQLPLQAALGLAAERPLRRREHRGLRRAVGGGLPLRLGGDLPLRACGRRVHHGDDEDRGDPDGHRPPRAPLPPQRLGAGRDADGRLRTRRHVLRDVGGDARLLRAARATRTRARLRPHGRGGDHLPRRRQRRDRLDREPVLDRRRLGRSRDHDRRRDRPADPDVARAGLARDRLRALVRAAHHGASREVDRRRLGLRRRRRRAA